MLDYYILLEIFCLDFSTLSEGQNFSLRCSRSSHAWPIITDTDKSWSRVEDFEGGKKTFSHLKVTKGWGTEFDTDEIAPGQLCWEWGGPPVM